MLLGLHLFDPSNNAAVKPGAVQLQFHSDHLHLAMHSLLGVSGSCRRSSLTFVTAYAARFVPMLLKKRQECGSTKSPTRPMIRKRAKFQEHKSCSNLSCTVHHSVQLNRTHTLSFHFKTWHSSRKFLFCGGDRNDNLPKSPRKSMMLWVACLEVWNQCRYCISNFAVSKTATTPNPNVA